jgi:uncharacterized membrane protein
VKKVLLSGLIACFLIGIAFFFFRFLIVDVLAAMFGPTILNFTDRDFLVIPLTLVFTFIAILVVGFAITKIKLQNIYTRYFRRVPKDLEKGHGALVMFADGAYYLGIIIKDTYIRRPEGNMEKLYVLYCPSTPLPWSGLPVIYVEEKKVIPLNLSFGELYSLTGSFGANTPAIIADLQSNRSNSSTK